MLVRIRKSIAAFDWDYQSGAVVDLDDAQARAWCASGVAEPCEPETAMAAAAPERAVSRGRVGRGR